MGINPPKTSGCELIKTMKCAVKRESASCLPPRTEHNGVIDLFNALESSLRSFPLDQLCGATAGAGGALRRRISTPPCHDRW